MPRIWSPAATGWLYLFIFLFKLTKAQEEQGHDDHDDHDMENEGGHHHVDQIDWDQPVDSMVYLHILFQAVVWGFIFPLGMVLGIVRSRFHVPLQITGTVLTLAGYFFGLSHGGRQYPETSHHRVGGLLFLSLCVQGGLGIYLKMHFKHLPALRKFLVKVHGVLGRVFPVLGWLQGVLGYVSLTGFCRGGHLGQCLAHYIMGSSFIAYGIILSILMYFGPAFVAKRGISQEYIDSWVICVWGIVNTFTEHDFLEKSSGWSVKDMQHSSMGVIWWAGGALGIFLGRGRKRNFVPAAILILTGWAMSSHAQAMMMSTEVHKAFGEALMGAGITRLVEICFILKGKHAMWELDPQNWQEGQVHPFQHLPAFLLVASGILFMSATDEELHLLMDVGMDHVTYILLLLSVAFVIYLWTHILIHIYTVCSSPPSPQDGNNNAWSLWSRGRGRENAFKYEAVPDTAVGLDDEYRRMGGNGEGMESVELMRQGYEPPARKLMTDTDRESPNHVLFDDRDEREYG